MARGTTFIGWIAGGSGIVLLYSAYRNRSPLDVVRSTLGGGGTTVVKPVASTGVIGSIPLLGNVANSSRAGRIANETIQPTLVPIPTQPTMLLDIEAMQSFLKVQLDYGRPIILTGAFRTQAQQDQGHALHPETVAGGTHSLHLDGLAVDVNGLTNNWNDPKLVDAFTKNGWYRRGKVLADGKPEAWHWSYGVPG